MNCQYCFHPACTGVGPCPKDEMDDESVPESEVGSWIPSG